MNCHRWVQSPNTVAPKFNLNGTFRCCQWPVEADELPSSCPQITVNVDLSGPEMKSTDSPQLLYYIRSFLLIILDTDMVFTTTFSNYM